MRTPFRIATAFAVLCCALVGVPVRAQGPDYGELGRFTLPWACDQAHRISWDPQGHWANGKARGVAFDFAMPVGTALVAPADGLATWARDDRRLETTYGYSRHLPILFLYIRPAFVKKKIATDCKQI